MPGLLSRDRTIAAPGFDRWLVPPAALAIHLSIGMAYGFSVFWLPLSRAVGVTAPVPCAADLGFAVIGRIVLGLPSHSLFRPVDPKHFMQVSGHSPLEEFAAATIPAGGGAGPGTRLLSLVTAWLGVGLPMGWGIWMTLQKALQLFR